MYTEISKIIEGGLNGDREKVYNYAKVLADNLENSGDRAFARKIQKIIENRKGRTITLDSLSSKPVDGESRMEMVEITYPFMEDNFLVLNKDTESEIQNFVRCYFSRDKLISAGLDEPNSLLLYGPPGCGKTTIAKYISSKTKLPLITARLDGVISSLLGSTAKNIRKIFDFASRQECILFLDEFDIIAKARDDKNEMGELKRVVNSLIQNIDGFNRDSIIIAATNHHEMLDMAIWRRFNRILALNKPSASDIYKIISRYMNTQDISFSMSLKNIDILSKAMLGLSHADVKTVINQTIKNNLINNVNSVSLYDILRETYLFRNHAINNEETYLKYLINNGITHRQLHSLGFSLRTIRKISKDAKESNNHDRTATNKVFQ